MKFHAESDSKKGMVTKTLHQPKTSDLYKVLIEWILQHWSEKVLLSGPMVIVQVKVFHEELHLITLCD